MERQNYYQLRLWNRSDRASADFGCAKSFGQNTTAALTNKKGARPKPGAEVIAATRFMS
jgi:hypothetical protein